VCIKSKGADFVYFVDTSVLPADAVKGFSCVVLFGKALTKGYINALRANEKPKTNEVLNTERKMDNLAIKVAEQLEAEGFSSMTKLKFGRLPHKTVVLNAGLGFIGKNNLLVTEQYGCAVLFGKVLTTALFEIKSKTPIEPKCGDCTVCVDVCQPNALRGTTWDITTKREDMMVRKHCALCLKCMIWCPYTERYAV
jgi:epoxyqueuosine reductase QueG